MNPLCDFCEEREEGETIFESPNKTVHICERCVVKVRLILWKEKLLAPLRERIWVMASGLGSLLVIGLLLLAACATCPETAAGCPPFPFAYEPHP